MSNNASDSFLVLEQMIRNGEIGVTELQHLLATLESQGQIRAEECKSLLDLAAKLDLKNRSSA